MASHYFCRHLRPLFLRSFVQPVTLLALSAALVLLSWPAFGACPDDATPAQKQQAASAYAQVRLYNFRHAAQLTESIKELFPLLSLSSATAAPPAGADDILVAVSKNSSSPPPDPCGVLRSIEELKRFVALLDLPRPQVTLQVWSIKVSSKSEKGCSKDAKKVCSKDADEIADLVKRLQQQIDDRNLRIQKALKFGWFKLMTKAQQNRGFLNEKFREYISKAFVIDETDKPKEYSLGYVHAFSPDQPSIATMLLCLAASDNASKWIDEVVKDMEQPEEPKDVASPTFPTFKAYLHALVDPEDSSSADSSNPPARHRALRAALADFLFQYKLATLYPHDFVGYDLQNSATVLDSLFAPAVDALNHDVEMYVGNIIDLDKSELTGKKSRIQLASRGIITVAALSGQQATVQGKIVSFFDVTKPPSLSEMVQGMSTAKTNLSALFPQVTGNPALVAAALAALSAQDKTFVQIEKGMNLIVTPTTLATAASAELDISVDAGDDKGQPADDADPRMFGAKTDQTYAVDRIAKHSVKTRVRVDSLRLFEVSTFSFDLMHPQPDGVVPVIGTVWQGVFGAVPYVGRLFTWHKAPEISTNRSVIIVSALIVPTSMDLALGIRVESDRKLTASTTAAGDLQTHAMHLIDDDLVLGKARPFHKKKLECMLAPGWVTFNKAAIKAGCTCENLSLECIPADGPADSGTSTH